MTKLNGLISALVLATIAAPTACGDEEFAGCVASGTCSPGHAGDGGEAGGATDTGGTSGSGVGADAGQGGAATGGRTGGTGGIAGAGDAGEGGDGEGGAGDRGGEGGMGPDPDSEPPTIVSVSPADGATGVRNDANIVVTFSEPMDRLTTQAAYQSADIPAAGVTFSWNSTSTVLTINPNTDLAYAEGDTPAVAARQFTTAVTDTAEDRAGNPLAESFDWSFHTLRRITQTFTSGSMLRVSSQNPPSAACTAVNYAVVGDFTDDNGRFLFVSRDVSALPANILEWEAATLSAEQAVVSHAGVFDQRGPLYTYHVSVWPPEAVTWSGTPAIHNLPTFSNDVTPGTRSVDVLLALMDDYQHRTERNQASQYMIRFLTGTNLDGIADNVQILCDPAPTLTARYLIP